jgi:hypothetical protein
MGPVLIFDKSTLESLNPDQAVWLDNFFFCNITPLFFIETLADLEKSIKNGRTPEEVVGSLAYKTPDAHSKCNVHHERLVFGELTGSAAIEMIHGRPVIDEGEAKELDGKMGIVFKPSPEEEAFQRWQKKQFLELERSLAKKWRIGLKDIKLEEHYKSFQSFFPLGKPKSLADVKRFVDFYLDGPDQEALLVFGLSLLGVPQDIHQSILARWRRSGKQSLRDFAPYFTHMLSVDLFFYLGIASDLIGRGRATHKIDLAYLYYLPFCMVFTSSDKLHAELVPFFLRKNQSFVRGADLKADLRKLDSHYDALPEEIKTQGLVRFANYPPTDGDFLVTRLWDAHMAPRWRQQATRKDEGPRKMPSGFIEEMKRFETEGIPVSGETRVDSDAADRILVKRKVYIRKGKWTRFPPEFVKATQTESK